MKDEGDVPLASVDPIRNDGPWSAKGAAGDALQRVAHKDPILCIWIDDQNRLRWSKANTDAQSLSTMAAFALEMAQGCFRQHLDR